MPTPESELFLAKKPTVAPTFDGVDYSNNQQMWDARDAIIREQWVKQMMARLVREELGMSILERSLVLVFWATYKLRETHVLVAFTRTRRGWRAS